MNRNFIYITLFCFLIPFTLFAHQPNYVNQQLTITDDEPSISKAYYGELSGSKVVYTIYSTSTLELYIQILSPKIQDAKKDFTVSITDDKKKVIANLATSSENWQSWYEEFGGDWYWQGPSFKQIIPAGTYNIIVSNPDNIGKYSLAIGLIESFPVNTFSQMIKELYTIKTSFFNEPWYGIFYGVIGKFLLVASIIVIIIMCVFAYLLRNMYKNKL